MMVQVSRRFASIPFNAEVEMGAYPRAGRPSSKPGHLETKFQLHRPPSVDIHGYFSIFVCPITAFQLFSL